MASLKKLGSVPTLTQLYRIGKVRPSSQNNLPPPNQALNDKICTVQYDITKLEVDTIVNAANRRLLGGGGVDGAIHRAAGPSLYDECKTLGGCETGSAKITDAYDLPCKKVIHAVGPVYDTRAESEPLLKGCYRTSLQLAAKNDCKSIAFSAISTGIYGYPSDDAAYAALSEVRSFLEQPEGDKIEKVIFCNFMQKDVDAYNEIMPYVFPPTKDDMESKVRSSSQENSQAAAQTQDGLSAGKATEAHPSDVPAVSATMPLAEHEIETIVMPKQNHEEGTQNVVMEGRAAALDPVDEIARAAATSVFITQAVMPGQSEHSTCKKDQQQEDVSQEDKQDPFERILRGYGTCIDTSVKPALDDKIESEAQVPKTPSDSELKERSERFAACRRVIAMLTPPPKFATNAVAGDDMRGNLDCNGDSSLPTPAASQGSRVQPIDKDDEGEVVVKELISEKEKM
ncbi:hypothetical protein LTS08_007156 [Lithohypha guttulata]|nr:hypothetical protein LTS08_007156 [Lithohypha guttulata]